MALHIRPLLNRDFILPGVGFGPLLSGTLSSFTNQNQRVSERRTTPMAITMSSLPALTACTLRYSRSSTLCSTSKPQQLATFRAALARE